MCEIMTNQPVILLADDDENDLFLMRRSFDKAGIPGILKSVPDGAQAINYLKGEEPYSNREECPLPFLLLLDLKMPFKTGFEVLSWIRQQPGLKRLLVVVLTSSSQTHDINRAYDLGANSYLVKPGSFEDLVSLAQQLRGYWLSVNRAPDFTP
jgi:CheY-like chemotaxis protein